MSPDYVRLLDPSGAIYLAVEFETDGREVTDYAVVLIRGSYARETIRLYDGAHGHNEMHRYTASTGKRPGTPFHRGTLGEGMRAAISEIEGGFSEMIKGFERR